MLYRLLLAFVLINSLLIGRLVFAQTAGVGDTAGTVAQDNNALLDNNSNPKGNGSGINGDGSTGNNQVVSRDAIGLRIVPNPEHLSPLAWYYKNIKVKGSPQSMLVDGYEAVRDGRTVYVSAAKILAVSRCENNPSQICTSSSQCGIIKDPGISSLFSKFIPIAWAGSCSASTIPELYTNIYVISFNQNPESSTTDIFGQLLQYWKFNIDVANCSKTVTQACVPNPGGNGPGGGESGCPPTETCGPTGWCSKSNTQTCMIDSDCPDSEYCTSKKATIIRDTKRLYVMSEVKTKLENYNNVVHSYPRLDTGTYLANRTISTWPSWSATFSSTIGSAMPIDPVNKLGRCKTDDAENALFEASTCWNENTKEFAGTASPLTPPADSRVYYYQYKPGDNSFRFCTIFESGYVQAKSPMSELCQTGRSCNINCTNKQCGDNGCAGLCGTCASGQTCQSGHCRSNATGQD